MSYEIRTTTNYYDDTNFYEFSEHDRLVDTTVRFKVACDDSKFYVDVDSSVRSVDVKLVDIDPDTYEETILDKFRAE